MLRFLVLAFGLCFLSGCNSTIGGPLLVGEAGSLVMTQKSLSDHIFTMASGMDCSSAYTVNGGDYCRPHAQRVESVPVRLYCYHSLGQPNCFTQPLTGQNDRLIGSQVVSVPLQ